MGELLGDYPAYTQETLVAEADAIVVGTAVGQHPTVLTPLPPTGDTPEENPLLGLSDEDLERALAEEHTIPATATTFHVNHVATGPVDVGDEVVVVQTGGTVDGVEHHEAGTTYPTTGETYLVFASASDDGTYAVLGGSVGLYEGSGDGVFTPTNSDYAPFSTVTEETLESWGE